MMWMVDTVTQNSRWNMYQPKEKHKKTENSKYVNGSWLPCLQPRLTVTIRVSQLDWCTKIWCKYCGRKYIDWNFALPDAHTFNRKVDERWRIFWTLLMNASTYLCLLEYTLWASIVATSYEIYKRLFNLFFFTMLLLCSALLPVPVLIVLSSLKLSL